MIHVSTAIAHIVFNFIVNTIDDLEVSLLKKAGGALSLLVS